MAYAMPLSLEYARRGDGLLPSLRLGVHTPPPELTPSGQSALTKVVLTAYGPAGLTASATASLPLAADVVLPLWQEALPPLTPLDPPCPSPLAAGTLGYPFWLSCAARASDVLSRLPGDGTWLVSVGYLAARQRVSSASYTLTLTKDATLTLWVQGDGVWMPVTADGPGVLDAPDSTHTRWQLTAARTVYSAWARRTGDGRLVEGGTLTPTPVVTTGGWESASEGRVGGSSYAVTLAPRLRRRSDAALLDALRRGARPSAGTLGAAAGRSLDELTLVHHHLDALEIPDGENPLGYSGRVLAQLDGLLNTLPPTQTP